MVTIILLIMYRYIIIFNISAKFGRYQHYDLIHTLLFTHIILRPFSFSFDNVALCRETYLNENQIPEEVLSCEIFTFLVAKYQVFRKNISLNISETFVGSTSEP